MLLDSPELISPDSFNLEDQIWTANGISDDCLNVRWLNEAGEEGVDAVDFVDAGFGFAPAVAFAFVDHEFHIAA